MKKTRVFWNVISAVLICVACLVVFFIKELDGKKQVSETAATIQSAEATAEPTAVPTPTPTPTPAPTETPEPVEYLEAGEFQSQFTDPETGYWMNYWVLVPEKATKGMPLITFLHGDGRSNMPDILPSTDIAAAAKDIYGDEYPFILLLPNNRYPEWYEEGMGTAVKNLIDTVADQYDADRDHIVLTGHSRGAIAVWEMTNDYGTYFSCAVPVSCGATHISGRNFIGVPVHGVVGGLGTDWDAYYPEMKYFVQVINDAGGQAELQVLDGYDHGEMGYAAYSQELFEWMIAQ